MNNNKWKSEMIHFIQGRSFTGLGKSVTGSSRLKSISVLIIILAMAVCGYQESHASIRYGNIRFRQYSVADGLPHNTIYAIAQDKDGYMWFGTPNGLCRFGGYTFRTYTYDPSDSTSIFHDFISNLHYDPVNDKLWIVTDKGFGYYDFKTDRFRRCNVDGISRKAATFINTGSGCLLLGTYGGIYRYDPKNDCFADFLSIPDRITGKILQDSKGILWFKSGSQLMRYDPIQRKILPVPPVLEKYPRNISNIFISSNDRLFFTDGPEFLVYDIRNDKFTELPKNIQTNGYRCIQEDADGNIWIGTEFGIFIYDAYNHLIEHLDHTASDQSNLNDSPVYCIFRDRSNNMWAGTYFSGINYYIYGTDQFHTWSYGSGEGHLSGKGVRQIVNDRKGGIYIATEDGGLNYMDKERNITHADVLHKKFGLDNVKNVHSIHISKDGDIWIGLFLNNVMRLSPSSGKRTDYNKSLGRRASAFFIEESSGNVYYGGPEGLYVIPDKGNTVRQISGERVFCSLAWNDTTLWIGTRNNGLYALNTARNIFEPLPLLSEIKPWITFLYRDSAGRIWIGTNNNGLYITDTHGRIHDVLRKTELGSNAIKGITEDLEGIIWAGTDNGLCRINPANLEVTRFSDSDGLPIKQFNFSSACLRPDGELYFGTINGMVSFYPDQLEVQKPDFKVKISNMYNNSDKISSATEMSLKGSRQREGSIRLSYKQAKSLRLEYSGLNFRYTDKTVYAMRLAGIDKKWQYVGNQHQVRFSNLPQGNYVLQIKAGYDGKTWDEAGQLDFPIYVKAPWWFSGWAIAAYLVLALSSACLMYRYLKARILLKMKLKSEMEKRRNMQKMNRQKIDFFSYVSHDLKTPLTLILSPLQQLIAKDNLTNDDKKKLEIIYTNADRMNYLIDELLTFSKIEMKQLKINVRKGNLMNFIDGISQIFGMVAKDKDIEFIKDIRNSDRDVWFSPSKIERILYNLLSNAFKYTKAGDYVKLSASLFETEESVFAEISVKDSGRGIPEEMISRIFENYFQVEPGDRRYGFGLGLSLTRALVKLHKGDIQVKSTIGQGSEFIVTLNVSENAYSPEERSDEGINSEEILKYNRRMADTLKLIPEGIEESDEAPEKGTVMIVEDNKELNSYLVEIFSPAFNVVSAKNGREAFSMLEKRHPDIIVSDVMMPEMDGLELLKKVRDNVSTSHIPVVLLTARTDESDVTKGYMSGADAYITKPFNATNLLLLVENILLNRERNIEHFRQSEELNIKQITNNPKDEQFMKDLMAYIMSNLANEELDVSDITKALHVSRSLLHNKVKSLSGSSITQLVRTIRMKEAKKFLLQGMNVSETSYAVGISDPNYFSKCFRKEFDITPTEFLKGAAAEANPESQTDGQKEQGFDADEGSIK